MKGSAPRVFEPLDAPRPKGARLLEAFSPKLGRRVRLFDHAAFEQWIVLEADPTVLCLCERPARLGANRDGRLIDFWVQRHDRAEMLLLDRDDRAQPVLEQIDGVPLRRVARAELAAAGIWIANWQRMLPVINATRGLLPKDLIKSVANFVREPVALSRVEHAMSVGDPSIARGAIFELLRTGRLLAPTLQTQPLSLHTLLEPA